MYLLKNREDLSSIEKFSAHNFWGTRQIMLVDKDRKLATIGNDGNVKLF